MAPLLVHATVFSVSGRERYICPRRIGRYVAGVDDQRTIARKTSLATPERQIVERFAIEIAPKPRLRNDCA